MECVSPERLCALASKGGLNIVDFSVKCTFLHLFNFVSLRDNFASEKWHYFTRYFLGRRLLKFDTRFKFNSNSIPSSSMPSRHFQNCLEKLTFLFDTHKHLPDDLSCRNIYQLLLSLLRDVPRCAGSWDAVLIHPNNRWASVWRKSRLKLHPNKIMIYFGLSSTVRCT